MAQNRRFVACWANFVAGEPVKAPRWANFVAHDASPVQGEFELRPVTWTRLMVAVMRLPVGPDPGILPGSGP